MYMLGKHAENITSLLYQAVLPQERKQEPWLELKQWQYLEQNIFLLSANRVQQSQVPSLKYLAIAQLTHYIMPQALT